MRSLEEQGIRFAFITLHIGLDTFQPVREEDPLRHLIHKEWMLVPEATAEAVNATRAAGGRVIAVGTTAVRALESAATEEGKVQPFAGEAGLYIYPGYQFRTLDGIITNFHLPRSTLLLLVAAFVGLAELKRIYAIAIAERYRFYSFGDASLLL